MTPNPAQHEPQRLRLSRATVVILVGYVALIVALMVIRGAYISPDLFVIFALVIAVVLGRTRLFLRDWLPVVAIFLGWESMRGLADQVGMAVHSEDVIALERAIFLGRIPAVELQRLLHTVGSVNALDLFATFLYVAHFALPLTVGFVFWLIDRSRFYRYLLALMLMSFTAFVAFLLLPVAPPRFAGTFGEALAVEDIARVTFERLQFAPVTTWLYGTISGNPVAAFPSLHSAYPLLAFFFVRERWPRGAWLMLLYSAAVWFAVVYLAHHYVVDVIGGVAWAAGAYYAMRSERLSALARRMAGWRLRRAPSLSMPRRELRQGGEDPDGRQEPVG